VALFNGDEPRYGAIGIVSRLNVDFARNGFYRVVGILRNVMSFSGYKLQYHKDLSSYVRRSHDIRVNQTGHEQEG
jgi:hypothetical protein